MNVIHKISALLTVAVCMFMAASGSAEGQESGIRASVVSIVDDTYPNARAVVGVEHEGDNATFTLDAAAFAITIDGAPVSTVSAELAASEDAPLDLLFVIDTSGSMNGAPLASAKAAAKALIAELGAQDRIALLHFGDEVRFAQDFTADRALINAALDGLVAQGNTALYQATAAASIAIADSKASRRAVVLLSDGADFGGRSIATREEAIGAAATVGVPFFAIAQGTDLDRLYLQQIADVTKGRYLEALRPEDLDALYVSIGRLLRSQYIVTFDASSASISAGSKIAITVTAGASQAVAESTFKPDPDFQPSISILGLAAGDAIDEPREVTISISGGALRVRWYVDDVNVLEANAAPYGFTIDPAQFTEGAHTLRVTIGDGLSPIEASIAFSSTPPEAPSGGGMPIVPVAGVAGVLLVAGAALFAVRRRAPRGDAPIPVEQRITSWATQVARNKAAVDELEEPTETGPAPEDVGQALGLLISRGGSDLGSEYTVGGKPVSIGAGSRCGVHIKDPGLASEEARIWVRGDHLMLHMFTRLSTVESGGNAGGWQILGPGDTFPIGEHTFEFQLLTREEPLEDTQDLLTDPGSVPNILRDAQPQPRPQPQLGHFSDMMPRAD
jgi:VWFA-related protein